MAGDVEAFWSRRVGIVSRDGCDLVDGWGNEYDVVFSIKADRQHNDDDVDCVSGFVHGEL